MDAHLFDASGLVKHYLIEPGTAWVNQIVDPATGNQIRVASLAAVEVVSAIMRRQSAGTISAAHALALVAAFRRELANQFLLEEVTPTVFMHAMDMARKHSLRGADAVHLAVAVAVNTRTLALGAHLIFVCADSELRAAAVAEGLTVEDPSTHP